MAILDDKKWNILHIQNSFIVDPSGTCDLIHPRDQLTLAQLAQKKENDEPYDSSPEIRPSAYDRNTRPRCNTDKLLSEAGRPNRNYPRHHQHRSNDLKPNLILALPKRKPGPLTADEVRERLAARSKQSIPASMKIVEERPVDMRPFAAYQRYEVNANMRQRAYNVQMYQQRGLQRFPLNFGDSHTVRISIKEDVQFKHLVGLACFRYTNGQVKPPEIELVASEITPAKFSLYMIMDGEMELDWQINLDQHITETFFDIDSIAQQGHEDSVMAIFENVDGFENEDEEVTVLFRLNEIPIYTEYTYERKLVVKKSTTLDAMMNVFIVQFGVGQPTEHHRFCLNYVSNKGKEIRLNLASTLQAEIVDKSLISANANELRLEIAQERVSQEQTKQTSSSLNNYEPNSYVVKLYSNKFGAKGQEHKITLDTTCMDVQPVRRTSNTSKSLMNRLTPIKTKINTIIYFDKMIDMTDLGVTKSSNGRYAILLSYMSPDKFEKLDIRGERKTILKIIEHLTLHKVKLNSMTESSGKVRRRSAY